MAASKKALQGKAKNEVARAKTADELNRIIARHIDLLESGKATEDDVRLSAMVSGFIGRQVSVENVRISFERLAALNEKSYAFVS
jgi:hypothetical protein